MPTFAKIQLVGLLLTQEMNSANVVHAVLVSSMMTIRILPSGSSATQINHRRKIHVVFLVTLNVLLRIKDLAFNSVDSPRNLMVIITAFSVENKMICSGIFLK
jgi:hypothetical protein